jgi:tRNA threonylcarbamoyladenosine modification (KEOPS) complex  Pcc1 subunit
MRLTVELDDEKKVISALLKSLQPETIASKRLNFSVSTKNTGRTLLLTFVAEDLVSLRSGMNTILRLVLSALKSIRAIEIIDRVKSSGAVHRKTE